MESPNGSTPSTSSPIYYPPRPSRKPRHGTVSPTETRWPNISPYTPMDNPRLWTPPTTINGAQAHHLQLRYQPRPHWIPPSRSITTKLPQLPTTHHPPTPNLQHRPWKPSTIIIQQLPPPTQQPTPPILHQPHRHHMDNNKSNSKNTTTKTNTTRKQQTTTTNTTTNTKQQQTKQHEH